jgi:hypothetical protein
MAYCSFTSEERQRMAVVAEELNSAIDDFFRDSVDRVTAEEWDLLIAYATACVKRALEVGAMLRGIADGGDPELEYPGRGRETFVREALVAWRDSFAPIRDVWRLAPVFEKIDGGECRALADVAALEVMAANRMFMTLDEQYQTFFASE